MKTILIFCIATLGYFAVSYEIQHSPYKPTAQRSSSWLDQNSDSWEGKWYNCWQVETEKTIVYHTIVWGDITFLDRTGRRSDFFPSTFGRHVPRQSTCLPINGKFGMILCFINFYKAFLFFLLAFPLFNFCTKRALKKGLSSPMRTFLLCSYFIGRGRTLAESITEEKKFISKYVSSMKEFDIWGSIGLYLIAPIFIYGLVTLLSLDPHYGFSEKFIIGLFVLVVLAKLFFMNIGRIISYLEKKDLQTV